MKITVGAHPDVPFPWSNGPEPQQPRKGGRSEPFRLATERHERGRQAIPALVNYWLGRSKLSHDQLTAIADWGLGERGWLDTSAISRARNARNRKGASLRHLDAMAAANEAIHCWQVNGESEAMATYGPPSGWGIRPEWLDDACWLPHPDEDRPLGFADLTAVLAGHLELPYLSGPQLSPGEAVRASQALVDLLNELARERGWSPREAIQHFGEAYPSQDRGHQQRLRGLLIGELQLTRDELGQELHALAEMIRVVRALEPGRYGPAELAAELQGSRPRPA